jgi:hypothetical protein
MFAVLLLHLHGVNNKLFNTSFFNILSEGVYLAYVDATGKQYMVSLDAY